MFESRRCRVWLLVNLAVALAWASASLEALQALERSLASVETPPTTTVSQSGPSASQARFALSEASAVSPSSSTAFPTSARARSALDIRAQGVSAQEVTGTLVVVNKRLNTLSILDVASGDLLARLPTGNEPHEVVLTSDGSTAIVTDYGGRTPGHTLTVVDVPGLGIARTIDLGRHTGPHGISVLPGDELVAVTSEQSAHVVIVRIADGEIVAEIPTGHRASHMLAMVGDGRTIYTSNMQDGTVSALDVERGTHEGTVRVPARPEAIGVTADGEEVWVGSNDEGSISAIDPATGEVERVLEGLQWPYRILFTPDARLVLIPDLGGNQLRIVDRATRRELAVLDFPGGGPQGITLSADARVAFLSLSRQSRVVMIDLETYQVVRAIQTGETPDGVGYTTRLTTRLIMRAPMPIAARPSTRLAVQPPMQLTTQPR